jgi:hypothetical protein
LLIFLGGTLLVLNSLLGCGGFGFLCFVSIYSPAMRDVAIIAGAGLKKTYTSVSGGLLCVFTCCFLASHFELRLTQYIRD